MSRLEMWAKNLAAANKNHVPRKYSFEEFKNWYADFVKNGGPSEEDMELNNIVTRDELKFSLYHQYPFDDL